MKNFMDEDFLLNTETSKILFHQYAENIPICDYHCHLSAKDIYENKPPADIAELWLSGDHYKWRAMRSCGVSEEYCTGNKPNKEKFQKFAYTVKYCVGNPLYHWAHLELQRYFNIFTPLSDKTADEIWQRANEEIKNGGFAPQSLIKKSNVKIICTTDDPIDSLEYHKKLKNSDAFDCLVLPTFRPDRALGIELDGFADYIKQLEKTSEIQIQNVNDVVEALFKRADYFNAVGCKISDQSFSYVPYEKANEIIVNEIFNFAMENKVVTKKEIDIYKTYVMLALGKKYKELGWAMELHMGAMRNNNTKMFNQLGADIGFDSVGDSAVAEKLSQFLNSLDKNNNLPKTILFNLNPKDNVVLGAMLGNFQSNEFESKIQYGPAWWFLDSIDGMTEQMKTLANLGVLGKFVGMETDSRSFTSYARHEYFRRIMCELIGSWVENGMYANDECALKEIVQGISYNNAINYFNF